MDKNNLIWIAAAILAVVAVAAVLFYNWRQDVRRRRVRGWIENYLTERFGALPRELTVNCSDDAHWPVLVGYTDTRTDSRRRMQFSCAGGVSTYSALSDVADDAN